ncbi:olfactory receptor 13H1-like [Anomaloglossus baeobatrachus]
MELGNQTLVTEFILIGFSQNFQICISLFILFFIIYILTIFGNGFLIFTVIVSPQLHTPMYYFLCNLSFLDLCYSTNALPRFLHDLLSKNRNISVPMCLTQMIVCFILAGIECILLAVMAYDRYIAICFPLHYTTIMSWKVCRNITISMWFGNTFISSFVPILQPFDFCKENQINHFYCEALLILELACSDISLYKLSLIVSGVFTILSPPVFIVVTYIFIIISILKIRSSQGRSKAFSTCASHLTLVVLFYGTCMTIYMGQMKNVSPYLKYISLIYIVVTPLLNPLIYSLRNNEVKGAFAKTLSRCLISQEARLH